MQPSGHEVEGEDAKVGADGTKIEDKSKAPLVVEEKSESIQDDVNSSKVDPKHEEQPKEVTKEQKGNMGNKGSKETPAEKKSAKKSSPKSKSSKKSKKFIKAGK